MLTALSMRAFMSSIPRIRALFSLTTQCLQLQMTRDAVDVLNTILDVDSLCMWSDALECKAVR